MSSNILANASTNDPAAQRALRDAMNLRFTHTKQKAAHLNIDPISAWITNTKHRLHLLLTPILAGVVIINDKDELEPISMPTSMINPDGAFDTAAIWGNSLSSATFVAVDTSELTGSILRIISKANALEHKFTFLDKDLHKELSDRTNPADKFKVPHIPSDLNDINKSEDEDIPVFALIPKAIPFEFDSDPPMLLAKDVDAIASFQLIGEAAAIIGEAWQLIVEHYGSDSISELDIFNWGYVDINFETACKACIKEKLATSHCIVMLLTQRVTPCRSCIRKERRGGQTTR
jgi:hypothetical protein